MNGSAANKIVYSVLGLLLVAVAVLVFLSRGDADLRRALEENREFEIRIDGANAVTVSLQALVDMDPDEFKTSFATSVSAPREVTLRGVELRILLDELKIDASQASHFVISGLDSYYSPLTREEVEREGLIYLCFAMDGEVLKTRSDGGYEPFLMVIRGSSFAQRWCKYVEAVDVIIS